MSWWIDADALITDLNKGLWGKDWDKVLAEAIINDAPSIEIVRCKECIWFDTDNIGEDYCMYVKGLADANADDFCSYGERESE